jgi:UDP-glucose 6-dehydrogenase
MNEYQENRFVRAMIRYMFNTIVDKRIALFGFAFKADTSDTRESPAIFVARKLLDERKDIDAVEHKYRFVRYIEKTEGLQIIKLSSGRKYLFGKSSDTKE